MTQGLQVVLRNFESLVRAMGSSGRIFSRETQLGLFYRDILAQAVQRTELRVEREREASRRPVRAQFSKQRAIMAARMGGVAVEFEKGMLRRRVKGPTPSTW